MHLVNNEFAVENVVLDPAAHQFLDQLAGAGGPPIYKLPVADAREVLESVQRDYQNLMPASMEDLTIPVGPSGSVSIRILKPLDAPSPLPPVMYFHGGGWVLGSRHTHDRLIREIANGSRSAVVFVEYSRAPEAPFPFALDECIAATKWIAEHGAVHGLAIDKIVLAGDSAGGNLAIATAMGLLDGGEANLAGLVLFYPVTDASLDTTSYHQYASGHFLEREGMRWFWDQYEPNLDARFRSAVSPLQASVNHLQGLPPTLLITGECDVLRDEGEAFARKLAAAEVPTTAVRFLGIIHDFVMLNPLAETPAARAAVDLANSFILRAFAR